MLSERVTWFPTSKLAKWAGKYASISLIELKLGVKVFVNMLYIGIGQVQYGCLYLRWWVQVITIKIFHSDFSPHNSCVCNTYNVNLSNQERVRGADDAKQCYWQASNLFFSQQTLSFISFHSFLGVKLSGYHLSCPHTYCEY